MKSWAKRHLANHDAGSVALAVQALRNTQYVAIFIAGYAIKLSYAFINSIDSSNLVGYSDVMYIKNVRSLIVSVLLFCSRSMNGVSALFRRSNVDLSLHIDHFRALGVSRQFSRVLLSAI